MAEEVAGEKVWETVISVPAWFGVGERMAVLDAVELAGLRSIGLVNDGTAGLFPFLFLLPLWPEELMKVVY